MTPLHKKVLDMRKHISSIQNQIIRLEDKLDSASADLDTLLELTQVNESNFEEIKGAYCYAKWAYHKPGWMVFVDQDAMPVAFKKKDPFLTIEHTRVEALYFVREYDNNYMKLFSQFNDMKRKL